MQEGCIDNTTVPGHTHHKMGCKGGLIRGMSDVWRVWMCAHLDTEMHNGWMMLPV